MSAAILLGSPGTAKASLIVFEFVGETADGTMVTWSMTLDPTLVPTSTGPLSDVISYTSIVLEFDGQTYEADFVTVEQNEGLGEFGSDVISFTSLLSSGGSTISYTSIFTASAGFDLIQLGTIFTDAALLLNAFVAPSIEFGFAAFTETIFLLEVTSKVVSDIGEPATLFLLMIGLAGLGFAARRKAHEI